MKWIKPRIICFFFGHVWLNHGWDYSGSSIKGHQSCRRCGNDRFMLRGEWVEM